MESLVKTGVLGALLICLSSGCSVLHPGIQGSGVQQTQWRSVGPFREVKLAGFGNVNVRVGVQPSVAVTTDDNLLNHVETYVDNDQLVIRPINRIRPRSDLRIDITVPELTSAKVSGAGNICVDGMQGEYLEMSVSGAGTMQARGWVRHLDARISGAGDAKLQELYTESTNVRISGAGTAHVYADQALDARVSGAGDVVCYGNPAELSQKVTGAGSVTTADSAMTEIPVVAAPVAVPEASYYPVVQPVRPVGFVNSIGSN